MYRKHDLNMSARLVFNEKLMKMHSNLIHSESHPFHVDHRPVILWKKNEFIDPCFLENDMRLNNLQLTMFGNRKQSNLSIQTLRFVYTLRDLQSTRVISRRAKVCICMLSLYILYFST